MSRVSRMKPTVAALVSLALTVSASGYAVAGSSKNVDYTKMSAQALAEHLIFKDDGFATETKTQEGATVRQRLHQDALQKSCSKLKGGPLDSATVQKVIGLARESMNYPEGGIEIGDWKKGQALAENAYGWRIGHKTDDHSARETGGLCINCHAMEEDKQIRSGTLGPSLISYGEGRGMNERTKKYVYEVLYNPHVYFPCTNMPRFGARDVLTQQKISHIMAYLLDPDSPVNE